MHDITNLMSIIVFNSHLDELEGKSPDSSKHNSGLSGDASTDYTSYTV